MVIDPKKISVAYRCPHCGNGVLSMVGVFSLSGDMIKIKCSCGNSEMIIANADDGKLHLTVPCTICPNPHHYTVSKNLLLSGDIFTLGCTYTGLDTCFIGEHDKVLNALDESAKTLEGLMLDAGVESLDMLHAGDPNMQADDQMIDEIIRFTLADLAEEGKIYCGCREGDTAAYGYEFAPPDYEDLRVYCRTCGCEKRIPMTSTVNAHAFLNIDELRLEKPKAGKDE